MTAPRIRTTLPFGLVLLTTLLLACASTGPLGHWIEPVVLGDRVRVWAPSVGIEGLVGTVLALQPDTIVIDNDEPLVLAVSLLTKLEVSRGRQSSARTGGIVGLIGGAVAGAVICIASKCSLTADSDESNSRSAVFVDEDLQSVALAAVLGAAAGYGVGVLIGSTIKVDRWEEIPLDMLRVTRAPRPGGGP